MVVGAVIAAIGAALALLLLLPVRLTLRFGLEPEQTRIRAGLLGGLLPVTLLDGGRRKAPRRTRASAAKPPTDRRPRGRSTARRNRALRALPRLLSAVLGRLHVERLRVDAVFGTGDPALTGQIYGLLTPVIFGSAGFDRWSLRARPMFDKACLSGSAEGTLRFTPAAMVGPLLRFGWAVARPAAGAAR